MVKKPENEVKYLNTFQSNKINYYVGGENGAEKDLKPIMACLLIPTSKAVKNSLESYSFCMGFIRVQMDYLLFDSTVNTT